MEEAIVMNQLAVGCGRNALDTSVQRYPSEALIMSVCSLLLGETGTA